VEARKAALETFTINWEDAERYCLSAVLEFSEAEIDRRVVPVVSERDPAS
jgi:hypothetical protein